MRKYASSIEKGNNNTLILHVYPDADGAFNLLEDDGTSNDYLDGIYASTVIEQKNSGKKTLLRIHPVEGSYKGMLSTRKWILYIHYNKTPKQVKMNGQNIKFSFNQTGKIIRIETARRSVKQAIEFELTF